MITPSNAELTPICHLLALLGAHLIFQVSSIRVNAVESLREVRENNPNYVFIV